MADGFVVKRPGASVATWLNRTAAMVLELATGTNSSTTIAEALADAFQLDPAPHAAVERCLAELQSAGLINYDRRPASGPAGVLVHVSAPDGTVSAELAHRLVELVGAGTDDGFRVEVEVSRDTSSRRARNHAALHLLDRQDVSHVFFLGARTPVEVGQFRRVVQSGHDVVSTAPPNEGSDWGKVASVTRRMPQATPEDLADTAAWFSVSFASSGGGHRPSNGYLSAHTVPVDGLLVSRNALLKLAASETVPRSVRQWSAGGVVDRVGRGFFDPATVDQDDELDEDAAFCARWRTVGGQIWVDLSGVFGRSLAVSQRAARNVPQ